MTQIFPDPAAAERLDDVDDPSAPALPACIVTPSPIAQEDPRA